MRFLPIFIFIFYAYALAKLPQWESYGFNFSFNQIIPEIFKEKTTTLNNGDLILVNHSALPARDYYPLPWPGGFLLDFELNNKKFSWAFGYAFYMDSHSFDFVNTVKNSLDNLSYTFVNNRLYTTIKAHLKDNKITSIWAGSRAGVFFNLEGYSDRINGTFISLGHQAHNLLTPLNQKLNGFSVGLFTSLLTGFKIYFPSIKFKKEEINYGINFSLEGLLSTPSFPVKKIARISGVSYLDSETADRNIRYFSNFSHLAGVLTIFFEIPQELWPKKQKKKKSYSIPDASPALEKKVN